jgi:hypothetical protein
MPRARSDLRHRRGLRAPGLRRRAHPDRHLARDGAAHADDLERGHVVLVHRLESGLVLGPGAPRRRRPDGQAVPDVRRRYAVAARLGGGAPPPTGGDRGAGGRSTRQARSAVRGAGGGAAAAARPGRNILRQRGRGDRCHRVLRRPTRTMWRSSNPDERVLRRQGGRTEVAAVVLLGPVALVNLLGSPAKRTTAGPRAVRS